jgi:hypothetical protein
MSVIRATCPECSGDAELAITAVHVLVNPDRTGVYRFRCEACGLIARSADKATVDILAAAGVPTSLWHPPVEALPQPVTTPITFDSVLDAHHLMNDNGALAAAIAALREGAA